MDLTHHPFQRAGARAVAAMSGRAAPAHLTPADLDQAQEVITADAVRAAHAPKGGPGAAWWLALAAAYPNSPVVHPVRVRRTPDELDAAVRALFAPDTNAAWHCWCCDAPAAQRWGKSLFPMLESVSHINSTPGGVGGQPTCRSCRIALWALPYASHNNGAHLVTGDTDDEDLARALTSRALARNRAVIDQGLAAWPRSWVSAGLAEALQEYPAALTSILWRNDNREPHLVERTADAATARWWASLPEEYRTEVRALTAPKPVWYLLAPRPDAAYAPCSLLHSLASQARTAALDRDGDPGAAQRRAWMLAGAAELLAAGGYLVDRGVDGALIGPVVAQVAPLLAEEAERTRFVAARLRLQHWQAWLQERSAQRLTHTDVEASLITAQQWELLFGEEETAFAYRDLLMTGVLFQHGAPVGA